MGSSSGRWRRVAGLLLLLAALLAVPLAGTLLPDNQSEFLVQQVTTVMIAGLLAMSLDLLVGVVGLVSLGHAAFYGLSAYLLVLATPEYEAPSLLTTVPLAVAGTAVVAAAIGVLVLRTSGIYFIMVTLAVGQMLFYLFNDSKIAGGSDGVYLFVRPNLTVGDVTVLDFENKLHFYYATLAALAAAYGVLRMLLASPFGQVIRGIGINEGRTRSLGYDVFAYKLVAYVVAATLAAVAGVLGASQYGFVNPTMLGWHASGTVLVTVILGGMGTLIGPVLGAFAVEILRHVLEHLTSHWLLPFGVLIILMVLALPGGLAGLPAQLGALRRRPAGGPAPRRPVMAPPAAIPAPETDR
ncbi:branched-chain amino acid ABC transporter permease [Azospirillum sp. ST 5-10]|uniref:branched-chain amino acid ABC transporter permease n=1 Tax=unclassified Azospirillum TaxID=2630922 RepID=UPI003F4A7B5A